MTGICLLWCWHAAPVRCLICRRHVCHAQRRCERVCCSLYSHCTSWGCLASCPQTVDGALPMSESNGARVAYLQPLHSMRMLNPWLPSCPHSCPQEVGDALFMSEADVHEARAEAHRELIKDESTAEEREVGGCSAELLGGFGRGALRAGEGLPRSGR